MWHYLTKIEKVSTSSLKCEYIFSYGERRNISFLKTAYWYGLNFLYLLKEFLLPFHYYLKIFYTFWNLKIPDNLDAITFLREKVSTFPESRWYMYTLWLLITLCSMPKGLVTYLQGKQQLCIHMLYESLVGQCSFFFVFFLIFFLGLIHLFSIKRDVSGEDFSPFSGCSLIWSIMRQYNYTLDEIWIIAC